MVHVAEEQLLTKSLIKRVSEFLVGTQKLIISMNVGQDLESPKNIINKHCVKLVPYLLHSD